MSKQHLREWIDSRCALRAMGMSHPSLATCSPRLSLCWRSIPNPQWDTKLAGWLQRVQSRATEEQSSHSRATTSAGASRPATHPATSSAFSSTRKVLSDGPSLLAACRGNSRLGQDRACAGMSKWRVSQPDARAYGHRSPAAYSTPYTSRLVSSPPRVPCAEEVPSNRAAQGAPKPSQGLQKLKLDLLELEARTTHHRAPHLPFLPAPNESDTPTDPHAQPTSSQDYIPWNAVVTNWANRRAVWARRLRECMDINGVVKHLLQLEQEQPPPHLYVRVFPHEGIVCSATCLVLSTARIQLRLSPQNVT